MMLWIALAVLIVAVIAGLALVVVRGLALRRDVKRSSAVLQSELDRISKVSLEIERQMAKADAATERLQQATDRLAISRAELDVQLAAIREARARVRRTFWFVPGV